METLKQKYEQFYKSQFIQTLIFNVATISAIVVGVFNYFREMWIDNKVGQEILYFPTRFSETLIKVNNDINYLLDHKEEA